MQQDGGIHSQNADGKARGRPTSRDDTHRVAALLDDIIENNHMNKTYSANDYLGLSLFIVHLNHAMNAGHNKITVYLQFLIFYG